jgi:nicotinate-nucleotide adenylyltransferase
MARIAFYGGSFDPLHIGHISIARALVEQFDLDRFVFIPAFHAPHKTRNKPTSAYDRFAMICLATASDEKLHASRIEIEMPERPYTVETLPRLRAEFPQDEIFFVMGADSWMEITTWREWRSVLSLANHIVVTRPGYPIGFDHVGADVCERIRDLRAGGRPHFPAPAGGEQALIYITDAVMLGVSATEIRRKVREDDASWRQDVSVEVANYIEKYQIYS